MSLEVRLDNRTVQVELVNKDNHSIEILVDGKLYKLDILMVEEGVYSILYNGKSYSVEILEGEHRKKSRVSTLYHSFNLEIIDEEARYLMNRNQSLLADEESVISSPMPGKVVKIPVQAGDKVKIGDTVIIVSAMKMESEYKAGKSGIIKDIHVGEGDTIEGHQPLITIE
jgi:biotin carboxyl carrier protein